MLQTLAATAFMAASSSCISIEKLSPVVNISVAEITQATSYTDKGNSFIWQLVDRTFNLMSFDHRGCIWRADVLHRDLAEFIIRFAGDGI